MEIRRGSQVHKNGTGGGKLCLWRTLSGVCIFTSWFVSLMALPAPLFNHLTPELNASINEVLLDKLNLSNYTVSCPEHYIYKEGIQRCQLVCGNYKILFPQLNLFKRLFISAIAIVNIGITLLASIRWVRIRKQTKFQHHPIIIGVLVNLLQAFIMGIPDIIGGDIIYCGGKEIDYGTFNNIPTLQLHLLGGILSFLGLSNRLWFTSALVLILVSVSFPLRDLFGTNKKRTIIITIEVIICVVYPMVCALVPFVPFSGYRLSQEILLPLPANSIISIICSSLPHLLISPVTMTLVVVIVYKIHSQLHLINNNKMKPQKVHPLEKRLMFFSIIYFLLNLFIALSFIIKSFRQNSIDHGINSYLALQTLQSSYSYKNDPLSVPINQTLSLLTIEDQLLIEQVQKPFAVYLHGIGIRLQFILVLSVLNISCQIPKFCRKKREKKVPEIIQNPIAN